MTHRITELQQAFAAPPPVGKRAFLRIHRPRLPLYQILLTQLSYIRKWVWGAAAPLYFTAVIGAGTQTPETLWILSACTPLTALAIISESGRSTQFGMAELEAATRFSLRTVLLARLSLLGIFSLLLLVFLVLTISRTANTNLPAAGLYLSVPFLLTAFLGLCITRRHKGSEGMYACVGLTFCVSTAVLLSHFVAAALYEPRCLPLWGLCAVGLCFGTKLQAAKLISKKEEILWT